LSISRWRGIGKRKHEDSGPWSEGLMNEVGERTIIKDMVKKAVERRNRVEFEEERQFRVGVRVNQNKII
jgi:hypothetical protein